MTKQQFRKEWLKNYKIISSPMSKVELETTSAVTEKNFIPPTEPGKSGKYIVTLKAITADKLPALRDLLKKHEANDEIPFEETNGIFTTASIWVREGEATPRLPMKNEKVDCNIDFVEDRDGNNVLRVTSLNVRPSVKAANLLDVYEDLFASISTGTEVVQ